MVNVATGGDVDPSLFFPKAEVRMGGYDILRVPVPAWGLACRLDDRIMISEEVPDRLLDYFCQLSVSDNTCRTFDEILEDLSSNGGLRYEFVKLAANHYNSIIDYFGKNRNLPDAPVVIAVAKMLMSKIQPFIEFDEAEVTEETTVLLDNFGRRVNGAIA